MKHIKNLVFDLDDTLYPKSLGCQELADLKVVEFLREKMNCSLEEYNADCVIYQQKYGSTYKLYQDRGSSFDDYLDYVCDNDMSKVEYNENLDKYLNSLPHQLFIYTNATYKHSKTIETRKFV